MPSLRFLGGGVTVQLNGQRGPEADGQQASA